MINIEAEENLVIVDLEAIGHTMTMSPEQARELAKVLVDAAAAAEPKPMILVPRR